MEFKITYNIHDINRDEWNLLVSKSNVFFNHEWFEIFQSTVKNPVYICAYQNGRLCGAIPGFIADENTYIFHNPFDALIMKNEEDFIKFLERKNKKSCSIGFKLISNLLNRNFIRKKFFPSFVCISPRGFIGDFFFRDTDTGQALLNKLYEFCRSNNIKTAAILWVEEQNNKLRSILTSEGFHELAGELYFRMHEKWKSFDEMLSLMNSSARHVIKNDLKKAADLNIKTYKGGKILLDNIDTFSNLGELHAAHTGDVIKGRIKEILRKVAEKMSDYIISTAESHGELKGFCVSFAKNSILFPKFEGYDQKESKRWGIHYNLMYYEQMRIAAKDGIREIDLGCGDPFSKLKRGFEPSVLYCYFKILSGNFFLTKITMFYLTLINRLKSACYKIAAFLRVWKDK